MISIIIPVHNGENFIRRALDSVMAQQGNWELIIVDDHSTDRTPDILAEYAAGNHRIIVLSAQTRGVTDARMTGVGRASGEYLFFMDADDELVPDVMGKFEYVIESDTVLDLVIADFTEIRKDTVLQRRYGAPSFSAGRQLFDWIIDCRTGFLWGKVIRRDLFLSLAYVPSNLSFCEDYIQMLQLSLKAKRIKHVGASGYIYYQNPDSACNKVKTRKEYAAQFYKLASAIRSLSEMSDFNRAGQDAEVTPSLRLKVMFLYYARLYLAVAGGWCEDDENLKCHYKKWMNESALCVDPLYDNRRKFQTMAACRFPWLLAAFYVPLLRYKYHRIK